MTALDYRLLAEKVAPPLMYTPLMSRRRFAELVGLPESVVVAQAERGYFGAPVKIGKYALINLEAIRLKAAERALEFKL